MWWLDHNLQAKNYNDKWNNSENNRMIFFVQMTKENKYYTFVMIFEAWSL